MRRRTKVHIKFYGDQLNVIVPKKGPTFRGWPNDLTSLVKIFLPKETWSAWKKQFSPINRKRCFAIDKDGNYCLGATVFNKDLQKATSKKRFGSMDAPFTGYMLFRFDQQQK